jgi:uncharacterized membrane protein
MARISRPILGEQSVWSYKIAIAIMSVISQFALLFYLTKLLMTLESSQALSIPFL